jgi:hypothetical protein
MVMGSANDARGRFKEIFQPFTDRIRWAISRIFTTINGTEPNTDAAESCGKILTELFEANPFKVSRVEANRCLFLTRSASVRVRSRIRNLS